VEVVYQKIESNLNSSFELAKTYYTILFELNKIHLTKNELNFVAFFATNGTASTPSLKKIFCERFSISNESIYNIISKLKKFNILYKDEDLKVRVNKNIIPDFSKDLLLSIKLNNDTNKEQQVI